MVAKHINVLPRPYTNTEISMSGHPQYDYMKNQRFLSFTGGGEIWA